MEPNIISGSKAQSSEASFISKVYLWMAAGLFISAVGSAWLLSQPELLKTIYSNMWIMFGIIAVEIGLVVWLSAGLMRMNALTATLVFLAYSFLNGVTLASIFLIYTSASIFTTFVVTAGTFLFFSLYGLTTRKDLTGVGSLAVMGLFGVIIASVINIFLKSSMLMWISTFVGIAVFLGLIAWDTQKLKALHANGAAYGRERNLAVMGALMLYLDFINLFILLLRIFGRQRD